MVVFTIFQIEIIYQEIKLKTLNEDLESKNNTLDESLNSINISNELLSFSINNSKKINDFINHYISNRISDIYLQLENAINYYD